MPGAWDLSGRCQGQTCRSNVEVSGLRGFIAQRPRTAGLGCWNKALGRVWTLLIWILSVQVNVVKHLCAIVFVIRHIRDFSVVLGAIGDVELFRMLLEC